MVEPGINDHDAALARIFDAESHNTVILALDDSAISGPEDGLRDMESAISKGTHDGVNAILGFYGMFRANREVLGETPGILNLTLSTTGPAHLDKVEVGDIEQVAELGLAGVSVHVNTTSPHEGNMLSILGKTARRANQLGIPLLAHMYPRTIINGKEDHYDDVRKQDPENYAKLVRHGARIAADLGADIIKVPWTGTPDSFHTVTESTYGLPVVMAGGPMTGVMEFLHTAKSAMESGARGIAVGRNFFKQPFIDEDEIVLLALYDIVQRNLDVGMAAFRGEAIMLSRTAERLTKLGWQPGMLESHERSFIAYRDFLFPPASGE
jgi:DhnA family fructose-bisphosphate aldolase class Ia